ncbi:hypothetical protein XSR1_40169 [Xenorhabdus szentirmaii DSM 16338]|uniref:Uncharacterized protein n=1 Tax=Xenorhabdus szentirmaii DSM 16338 TaxID=1427518 RepID=W1J3V7_9GAMM|nr:hypothetical protein XSR1_40169 [Xenorhabdus szentirmaii DSM 16338]
MQNENYAKLEICKISAMPNKSDARITARKIDVNTSRHPNKLTL